MVPELRMCPKCGALYPEGSLHRCPEEFEPLAKAYGTVISSRDIVTAASQVMGGTLKWLEMIPSHQRDIVHADTIVPQVRAMREELDVFAERLINLEEKFDRIDIEEFSELKKERQLFISPNIWKILPKDV